jgi:hypothetical protein
MQSIIRILTTASVLALLAGCTPGISKPNASVTKTLNNTQAVSANTRVSVENLVGHVEVTQGGSELGITATVVAGGKDKAAAQALADTIKFDVSNSDNHIRVHVHYPVDAHESYQYIPTHSNAHDQGGARVLGFRIGTSSSSLTYQGHDVRVYKGKSEGVPLHVDLSVKLPAGVDAEVDNHVGRIQAHDLNNTLALKTDSGDVSTKAITGNLKIRTGSGDVNVAAQEGSAGVHTGSGDVTVRQITGAADLHTGSGDIDGQGMHGDSLTMETGSGDIELDDISGALKLETGSGDVTLTGVGQVPKARIECGSGDIVMRGDLSKMQAFDLETGSGDVTLVTSQPPAVHLDIDGSDIDTSWPNLRNTQSSRRHFSADVGAATGQGRIRTGSGDVTLK